MKRRRAQTTVEYMITLSVISIAIAGILIVFGDTIQNNTRNLSGYLASSLADKSNGGDGVQP